MNELNCGGGKFLFKNKGRVYRGGSFLKQDDG